jgi:hypothetical protein
MTVARILVDRVMTADVAQAVELLRVALVARERASSALRVTRSTRHIVSPVRLRELESQHAKAHAMVATRRAELETVLIGEGMT